MTSELFTRFHNLKFLKTQIPVFREIEPQPDLTLELVYTKYEVKRSIIKGGRRIQPDNPVFDTLTLGVSPYR